jgi:hypothetical protein
MKPSTIILRKKKKKKKRDKMNRGENKDPDDILTRKCKILHGIRPPTLTLVKKDQLCGLTKKIAH